MPGAVYISIQGSKQGNITAGGNSSDSMGNKYQSNHTDESTVLSFDHRITVPRDPRHGQPTGQRVHEVLRIRKPLDKASPLLGNAVAKGEVLTKVEIKFWRTNVQGQQEHYYTIKLTDAIIVDITAETPLLSDKELGFRDHEEFISFSYLKIEWEHVIAGTNGQDTWRDPTS
ncbi:MAG: hypothetical protein BWK78_00975 [Thiotrichaceae bacterium IS1]|nr:MAG: hypothetical protein BWK78_00975 [Thiotrichaceae bacterium IS1]